MEKMRRNFSVVGLLMVALIAMLPGVLQAQTYDKPGNTTEAFLKMMPTPRGEAMGSAIIGLADNAAAVFSNPAGLMNINSADMEFGHTSMPAGVGLSYFSFAKKLGHHAIAISLLALTTDEMKVRTPLQPEGTGEYFSVGKYAYGLTYARNYTDKFKVGFTARLLNLHMVSDMYSELSWSGDIGLQYNSALPGILEGTIIAVTIRNFGPQVTYAKEGYGLPLNYTIGATRPVYGLFTENDRLALAINWNKCVDEQEKAQIGVEYSYNSLIDLRCGYKFSSGEQGATFGMGLSNTMMGKQMRFGYSFTPFGIIGSIHKFSLGFGL
ncbi:MAG: PorV/PorQ family protein [Candidatus Marinimicrobia bacterium]|nr:PorV/PorQ family protein [Candidatus Neomarinimicrobiota bacterium]